jgi:hypothetical protein
MTLPLAFHEDVRDEVDDAYLWYERQRGGLGEEFLAAVQEVLEQIASSPGLARQSTGMSASGSSAASHTECTTKSRRTGSSWSPSSTESETGVSGRPASDTAIKRRGRGCSCLARVVKLPKGPQLSDGR